MLLRPLSDYVGQAFADGGMDPSFGRVQKADRPDLADVQCNGALQAAKAMGQKPRDIAQKIFDTLNARPEAKSVFEKIDIAGPGFLNFTLTQDFLAQQVMKQGKEEKFGFVPPLKQKVLLEYNSPNVAKDMHVGHLRNTVIGDAVKRLLLFAGHEVITDNHLGDWGLQLGQVFSELQRLHPDWAYFDAKATSYPAQSPLSFEELCRVYPVASKKAKEDPEELKRAQQFTARLHQGDKGLRALWAHLVEMSVADIKRKLIDFGVEPMDTWYGESYFEQYIPWMMDDLKQKGMLREIGGALGIDVAEPTDKFEIPPLIVEKSVGGVTYSTTDIATFYQRQKDFDPDVCLILTDYRQELHFERVYRASKRAGYASRMKFVHLMYGTIDDKDGKPYKTRSGGTPSFDYLMKLIFDKADVRLREINLQEKVTDAEFKDISQQIGLAAMKFGDLINYRRSNYIFDLDKFVAFEGKTGPYIQYTVVRVNSLLQKAMEAQMHAGAVAIGETQKELALLMLEFPDAVEGSLNDYAPNILCDYLFRLAQSVNRLYQNEHIMTESDLARRGAALSLLKQGAAILTQGLQLLGIIVPKHM